MTTTTTTTTDLLARGFDGFEVRTADSGGVRTGYRVAGQGPPLVLLHGFPQTGLAWSAVARDLVADHRVVVVDLRGTGGSDAPATGYDKHAMAADVRAVLDDADVERAHVVGHDLGAMVAYAFARRYGDAALTLTMMESGAAGTPTFDSFTGQVWHMGFHRQVELATTVVSGDERAYFDHFFDTFTLDPGAVPDADRDLYAEAARRPGALAAVFRMYAAIPEQDAPRNAAELAAHGRLALPVLGLGGAASVGGGMEPLLAELADDRTAVVVPDCGHYLLEEQPTAVAAAVRSFVAEHAGVRS